MTSLAINVLGGFDAALDGKPLAGFESDKTRALLAYLAMGADRSHRREKVAAFLWPERNESAARANLRQALTNLRHVLREAGPGLLETSRQTVRLVASDRLWVDALVVCRLTEPEQAVPVGSPPEGSPLLEAVRLYRGEFLEGLSLDDTGPCEDWVRGQREHLQRRIAGALQLLADTYQQAGHLGQALACVWRLLALVPWDEHSHRQAMRLLALSGRRGAALAQFEACSRALADELGVAPEPETLRLREDIRGGRIAPAQSSGVVTAVAAARPSRPAEPEVGDSPQPAFVGRAAELARLEALLDRALAGEGGIALVRGEAGSGKTLLMARFALRVQRDHPDLVMAAGAGTAYTGSSDPYHPFREILSLLAGDVELGWRTGALTSEQAARLLDLAPATGQAVMEEGQQLIQSFVAARTLAERISALAADESEGAARLRELEAARAIGPNGPGAHQSALFEQYARVLARLAAQRPLLLLLDDLQWADAGTLDLLFHLARRLGGSRVFLLAASRSEDLVLGAAGARPSLASLLNELRRQRGLLEIDLGDCAGPDFVEALLDSEPNRLGRGFRDALLRRTGGHALFTVELLRGMRERQELVRDGDGRWVEGTSLDWTEVPTQVESAIAERFRALPPELVGLLRAASVQGDTFSAEVAARVEGKERRWALRLLSEEAERKHQLVSFVRLRPVGNERLSQFRFRNSLFQTYLYRGLGPAERAELHAEVARELESRYALSPADPSAAFSQLAWHFEESGRLDKAIDYRGRAARRAMEVSAYHEALDNVRPALALVERLPREDERVRSELALQTMLGAALTAVRGFADPETGAAYARARELCSQVQEIPLIYQSLRGAIGFYLVGGAPLTAKALSEQLVALSDETDDTAVALEGHHVLGTALFHLGDCRGARAHLERAAGLYDLERHAGQLWMFGFDPGVSSRVYLALCFVQEGRPVEALRSANAARRMARRIAHPFSHCYALLIPGLIELQLGAAASARPWIEKGLRLASEHAFPHWLAWSNVLLGRALAELESPEAGIARIREGLRIHRSIDSRVSIPTELGLLAEACLLTGRTEEGLAAIAEAFSQIDASEERWWSAELHRLKGELLMTPGHDLTEAERSLERAAAIARQQGTRFWEFRAALALCRLWLRQGRNAAARDRLEEICGWLGRDFDTPDGKAAQTLLQAERARS